MSFKHQIDWANIKLEILLFKKNEVNYVVLILLTKKILFMLVNGKMNNLMDWDNYTCLMDPTIMELLAKDTLRDKEGSSIKAELFIKAKLGII